MSTMCWSALEGAFVLAQENQSQSDFCIRDVVRSRPFDGIIRRHLAMGNTASSTVDSPTTLYRNIFIQSS